MISDWINSRFVGVESLVNELYGRAPQGSFCHLADPETCWSMLRRRSLLLGCC